MMPNLGGHRGELVGKVSAVDLRLGQGSDQDVQSFVLGHLAKLVGPPIIHHLKKFCVLVSVFVTAHPSHVVSQKNIGINLREVPNLLDKILQLIIAHLPSSQMVEKFSQALLAKEAFNLPAVAHLGHRFGVVTSKKNTWSIDNIEIEEI